MTAPKLNPNCALVRRTGAPLYESCTSCDLHLQNCLQFRGQLSTGALVLLVLGGAFLPLPTWGRGLFAFAAVGVVFHFLRYVAKASHVSIVTAARLRVERAQALETARKLDQHVTKLKEAQGQLLRADKLAAVGTMAAGVAHEINNPLSFVLSNMRFVREELRARSDASLPGDVLSALEEAEAGGQRVQKIVADLKTLSRVEAPVRGPVDLREAMASALTIARNEIRHRATLVERYEDSPLVLGDAGKLGQVFLNLVVNAVQAMPAGKAHENRLEIAVRRDGEWVVAEVGDTGAGIAPEHLSRLFEPFFTTKPVGVGTGLGLAICHSIVSSMGGDISVDSEVGRGTRVRVALPAASEAHLRGAEVEVGGPRATPQASGLRGRILVVDDEPLVARTVARLLRDHEVVSITDPREALARLGFDDAFDLVICDVMMPQLTGDEFHARLRERHQALAARTIFMTGGAFTPGTKRFLETVEHPWIQKPFDEDRLRRLVHELLQRGAALA